MNKFFLILVILLLSKPLLAQTKTGRMGIGMSNQLINDLPALSLKIQQNRLYSIGGLLAIRSNEDNTLYGAGLKLYRIIFQEEQLNFYMAGTFASLSYEDDKKAKTGYQVDGTMGSEFHFQGLDSIGFSFEFGVSVNRGPHGSSIETMGQNFLKAAIHFYL